MARDKSKQNPDEENPAEDGGTDQPSKMGAVREALGSLGYDAKPPALSQFILEKWGMDIPHNMISSYKSQLKGKKKKGKGGRMGRPPAVEGTEAKAASGNISMKDMQDVKMLAGRLGVSKLRKLVEFLS